MGFNSAFKRLKRRGEEKKKMMMIKNRKQNK